MKKNETPNSEAAELGTIQTGAVNLHKTRTTPNRTVERPPFYKPGITDPRTSK